MKAHLVKAFLATLVLFASATAHAQVALKLPDQSPAASVGQTVGLTEISVVYHRPGVNGRPIWGKLVPYGEPWRVGANENTTITFSTDVKVGGKPLKAGTYGLHALPTAKDWTIMFSTMSVAWGSFTYDQKEDAARITVTPRATTASEERLLYRFDDPTETKTTLVLAWEKLEVPITIEVETPKVAMASVRQQLRGPAGFSWEGYLQAATYWQKNGGPVDEALKLVDRSIQMNQNYQNLTLRAAIVEKQGNAKAAADLRAKAQTLATESDLAQAGFQLLRGDKKVDEALKVFQSTIARFPESVLAQAGLGESLAAKGDKPGAIAAYTKAQSLSKDPAQQKRIEARIAKLKAP
jgi:predicted negative regulator of RcsB-dependent stress response